MPFYSQTQSADAGRNVLRLAAGLQRDRRQGKESMWNTIFLAALRRWRSGAQRRVTRSFSRFTAGPCATTGNLESDFYLWPVYKFNRLESGPLERRRTRILFFLYSDTIENKHRIGLPGFVGRIFGRSTPFTGTLRATSAGRLSPCWSRFFPTTAACTREYSQVWSVWRCEKNHKSGAASQSLLWNLYRREETPRSKKLLALVWCFPVSIRGGRLALARLPCDRGKKDGARRRA